MASMNEEAIQMAVDYLLSADGSAPIEVQLSFLKSRMKMAPREIAEALRLTGLDGGEATAKPGTSATVVREAEQAQQAASEPAAEVVKVAEVATDPPRATTQPQALSTQAATQGYMAMGASPFPQQPSLVAGYSGAHGRTPSSIRHPIVDTRQFTKPITGAPAPAHVALAAAGGAPVNRPAANFQPQFTVGTSSRANMNNSRKSTQWGDDRKNAVGAIMGLGSSFNDEGGKENGSGNAGKRRPTSGRRAGQAYGSWTKDELRSSMNLGNAGSGAQRKTAAQKIHEISPADAGSYSGSGGYGRQGKFSQQQSLYRPRPDLVQHNNLGQYHETGMDPAANCITNGEGYVTSWSARGPSTKTAAPAETEYTGWHHEVPAHKKPAPEVADSGWFNNSTADAMKGRGQRAGRPKSTWADQNEAGDAMTGILGGGGGMSWGLGKTGDIKAHLPSIANGGGSATSPASTGYSLASANRSARLAGNSPRDLAPSAMYKPSQMDPRKFQAGSSAYYNEPEKITGYVAQYIS